MSNSAKSILLALVWLPVLTGQIVLVLTVSSLLHALAHDDHEHDLSAHSEIGIISLSLDHEDHAHEHSAPDSHHHEPDESPQGASGLDPIESSHQVQLSSDYTFSIVKRALENNLQLVVQSLTTNYDRRTTSEQPLAYRTVAEDPPDRAPDRSSVLRI